MRILIYDKMQIASGVPDEIKTPALSDKYTDDVTFTVTFPDAEYVDCIGIGYTDAETVTISDGSDSHVITLPYTSAGQLKYNNGLYRLSTEFDSATYTITHDGTYIGRVGIGEHRRLGTSVSKENGFFTTTESRQTLSGQVIPGAGGYTGRRIDLDVRYKIDEDVYDDIFNAYEQQISKNFPFFLMLDDEQHKLPVTLLHLYARLKDTDILLQSSTYNFLYSYKWQFYEAF